MSRRQQKRHEAHAATVHGDDLKITAAYVEKVLLFEDEMESVFTVEVEHEGEYAGSRLKVELSADQVEQLIDALEFVLEAQAKHTAGEGRKRRPRTSDQ